MSNDALLQRASCLASLDLQRAGFVPSPEECEELMEISSKLSDSLLSAKTSGSAATALRDRVTTQIAINRSIASPVWRLPAELFLLVMYHAIEDVEPFRRATVIADTIACVCLRWRLIALGEPELWSYVSSARPRNVGLSYPAQVALAKALPLHIQAVSEPIALTKLFRELRPHASRWTSIDVHTACLALEQQPIVDLPVLATAEIHLQGPTGNKGLQPLDSVQKDLRPFEFMQKSPSLRCLVIHLLQSWPVNAHWHKIHFPTLTDLHSFELHVDSAHDAGGGPPTQPLLHALDSCRLSLVDLHLDIESSSYMYSDNNLIGNPILFTALRHLTLAADAAQGMFRYILAPALEELTLRNMGDLSYSPVPYLLDFLSNHPLPNPKRLDLDSVAPDDPQAFIRCLERFRKLEELRVREVEGDTFLLMSEPVLQRLTCAAEEPPLLPNLSALRVARDEGTDQKLNDALQKMVASREEPCLCAIVPVVALELFEVTDRGSDESDEDV
ncbi:uncharacterized protein SCHCODRAFT_02646098 [Schizophyllum commune H4-8]|uniref:F-box domain-containing protein n=1 Tax=Schizophyllum commune (strain H4-8 / FGSC 9210) TaxID=578458 RepID=D8Q6R4_SCHCM|nr:uncharacterized protein SCHCODRAFT_02630109 [Schizophyllum commune H4-8]XP_050196857.1 uncharacterized protein SCHCODRAFT_02646098 [Schizophyllum commune H4-8]KAI5836579.1 hypothetical protein SCHCODRAFT_02646098 [Schizophyllum commune H4-8]KAI5891818.1 hypothetical protein SCHCODRAFT_02630109 [Schizophyllum commune H4-8]